MCVCKLSAVRVSVCTVWPRPRCFFFREDTTTVSESSSSAGVVVNFFLKFARVRFLDLKKTAVGFAVAALSASSIMAGGAPPLPTPT